MWPRTILYIVLNNIPVLQQHGNSDTNHNVTLLQLYYDI